VLGNRWARDRARGACNPAGANVAPVRAARGAGARVGGRTPARGSYRLREISSFMISLVPP
jgi:hypothetical protein